MPLKSRERITPELPRAPRSSAEATQSAAAAIVSNSFLLKLRRGLIHSQRHIGAGIPVGHGENVEVVYRLNIGMERCVGAEYHLFEGSGVYIISQLNVPPHGMGPPMPEFLSDDRVNINVNALDRDSGGLRELIADCIHNAA